MEIFGLPSLWNEEFVAVVIFKIKGPWLGIIAGAVCILEFLLIHGLLLLSGMVGGFFMGYCGCVDLIFKTKGLL